MFLVSARAVEAGISLGQLATAEKSSEITATDRAVEGIEIGGAVVTIDAAGCQRNIAESIIRGEGDYVLALKGNQGTLRDDVVGYIIEQTENDFAGVAARTHKETVKGHRRVDELIYHQLSVPDEIVKKHNWPGLRSIGVAIRMS